MPRTRESGDRGETTRTDDHRSEATDAGADRPERTRQSRPGAGEWFADTGLRLGLALVGFVLLLFALGQAFGVDLLGAVADALATETGRWLVVAVFALLVIAAAARTRLVRA